MFAHYEHLVLAIRKGAEYVVLIEVSIGAATYALIPALLVFAGKRKGRIE